MRAGVPLQPEDADAIVAAAAAAAAVLVVGGASKMLEAAAVEQSLFRLFQKIFVLAQTAVAAAAER